MMTREAVPNTTDPPRTQRMPEYEKLMDRVMKVNGCLIWLGPFHAAVGPMVKFRGKQIQVHRALWFYRYGVLPAFRLRRTCQASGCVSPDHRKVPVDV